jgi:CheY-like chemotaxis protein
MDKEMPKMNGSEAIYKINEMVKNGVLTKFPIIITSADNADLDPEIFLQYDMLDSLTKPITYESLKNKLMQFHLI